MLQTYSGTCDDCKPAIMSVVANKIHMYVNIIAFLKNRLNKIIILEYNCYKKMEKGKPKIVEWQKNHTIEKPT